MRTELLLIVVVAAVFGQTLGHGSVYDDFAIQSRELWKGSYTRPLTLLTFLLPFVHAVNVALHMLATVLTFRVLRLVVPVAVATAAAFLFALHPVQAEPVSYVWARSGLLMTVFCLLSLREWLSERPSWAVGWFALGLLSKEECVAFPLFLALLDWSRGRLRWKPVAAMLGLSVLAGASVWWAANLTAGSQAGAQSRYDAWSYLASQGLVILRYLTFQHGLEPMIAERVWWAWLAPIALAVVAARWFGGLRWGFWVLGGLVLLLPSSSVFPSNDLAADRRMYLPMIAFATAAGFLPPLRNKWALAIVATILGAFSYAQSRTWRDEQTLWSDVLQRNPGSIRARIHLGRLGDLARLEEAKSLAPQDALVASELGRVYLENGRHAEALSEFGRALAIEPDSAQAIANRGVALLLLGQRDAARGDFERALRKDPCLGSARHNLEQMGLTQGAEPSGCR